MSEQSLTEHERRFLLNLARTTIASTVGGPPSAHAGEQADEPTMNAGCFVSLHRAGHLRGCIGTFDTSAPVADRVREMAVAAATRDPRFQPVSREELPALDIEISVLTPPRRITDPSEITVGTHGVIVSRGYRKGVLLPQVATEYGWDRDTFLEHTCLKAGLPADAWEKSETVIEVFTAEVFGERWGTAGDE
jgi:AmmeMemoRadiSam system protein A